MADQAIYDALRAWDANGLPAGGALAYFYAIGTTTEIEVWLDSGKTVSTTNPVVADANGTFPQVYIETNAKVVVTTSGGETLYTLEECPKSVSSGALASLIAFSPTTNVPAANVQDAIETVDTATRDRHDTLEASLGDLATLDTITTAQVAAATLVVAADSISANDNDTTLPTCAAVIDHVEKNTVGGTPQLVTGSRAFATTYQNTTGRPLFVALTIVGNAAAGSAEVFLGATAGGVAAHVGASCTAGSVQSAISFMVPVGWHYHVNVVSGALSITYWSEFRA